jgi:L-lactate permease
MWRASGKWISPQYLALGASTSGLQGKVGDLLLVVLKWYIGLTVVMAILVVLWAYVLKFMVPLEVRSPAAAGPPRT